MMVVLRKYAAEDVERIASLADNPNVSRYLTNKFPSPYTHEDATWWVNVGCKQGLNRAIEFNGSLVGGIGVNPGTCIHSRAGEIGYWLGEEFWGRKIAREAVSKMVSMTFETTDLVRLFAGVFSPNIASMKVLEKCEFRLEGVLKKAIYKNGEFYDEHMYARIKK